MLFSKRLAPAPPLALCLEATIQGRGPSFQAELIPVRSPLLRESYLVPFPPLTYMLKFSGFADLTSCCAGVGTIKAKRQRSPLESNTTSRIEHARCKFTSCSCQSNQSPECATESSSSREPKTLWHTKTQASSKKRANLHEDSRSTEAGILPGISRECNARSSIHWFTEFCNSQ